MDSSVLKALTVLECFKAGDRELGVTELSKRASLTKSTVHRLCAVLVDAGYLQRTDDRGYTLGLRTFELASAANPTVSLQADATRFLHYLSSTTGETSHLAVLDQTDVVYISKIETLQSKDVPSRVGRRNPAHATGVGKVLLAWNPRAVAALLDGKRHLQRFTPFTITAPDRLREELATIAATGIAIDRGERSLGLTCVAAPIRDRVGHVVAALSVAGPSDRLTDERLLEIAPVVRSVAAAVSKELGRVR